MRPVAAIVLLVACGGSPAEPTDPPDAAVGTVEAAEGADPAGAEEVATTRPGDIRAPLSRKPGSKFTGAPAADPRRGPPTKAPEEEVAPISQGFAFDAQPTGFTFDEAEGFTFDEDLPPLPKGVKYMERVDDIPY